MHFLCQKCQFAVCDLKTQHATVFSRTMKPTISLFTLALVTAFGAVVSDLPAQQNSTAADWARGLSNAFADVYEKVSSSVVVIEVESAPTADPQSSAQMLQNFFQDPSGFDSLPPGMTPGANQGSGFIMTSDGYILTNNHVLEGGDRGQVRVTLLDGREFPASIVGVDPSSDLAVIKVEANDLPVIEMGDSDKVRVGEFAFAIGAPYDLRYTFTFGIVGATGRTKLVPTNPDYEEYIQTDASINPGNSGGPLVDIDGRVIGVNTMINGVNRGLGFAIPINIAKKIASQIVENGRFIRPWLGISIEDIVENPNRSPQFPGMTGGVFVREIQPGTPAARSELQPGDVILKVDGREVRNSSELQKSILATEIGQDVQLEVLRGNRTQTVKVRIAERIDGLIRAANQQPRPQLNRNMPQPTAGLEIKTITPDLATLMELQADQGVVVTNVENSSPAQTAQLQVGDVITAVNEQAVRSEEDFMAALANAKGRALMLNINRGSVKTFAILKP